MKYLINPGHPLLIERARRRAVLCSMAVLMVGMSPIIANLVLGHARLSSQAPTWGWLRCWPVIVAGAMHIPVLLYLRYKQRWYARARLADYMLCLDCGYDVSSSKEKGVCPECGAQFDARCARTRGARQGGPRREGRGVTTCHTGSSDDQAR